MSVLNLKSKRFAEVDQSQCVACGECAYVCPKGVATVEKGKYAVIDASECVGCGLCAKSCPAGSIKLTEREVADNE